MYSTVCTWSSEYAAKGYSPPFDFADSIALACKLKKIPAKDFSFTCYNTCFKFSGMVIANE